jgi:nitrogen fixation/metabolism regulation signal transduction histidine kinase
VGFGFYLLKERHLIFIPFFMIVLIGFQIAWIIELVNRANKEITDVFERIKNGNYLPSLLSGKYSDSFSDLFYTINDLFSSIRNSESSKEAYNIFTEMLVSGIPVGVILVESDGKIKLINDFALDLLKVPHFSNWKEIQKYLPGFAKPVDGLDKSGTGILKIESNGQLLQLSVNVRSIILFGEMNRVITFHDIRNSIGRTEIEAWSKLFRVIRHEILNSVTPISSLAETMKMILSTSQGEGGKMAGLSPSDLNDIKECINAIKLRSDGLYSFVNLYRDISRVPVPVKKPVSVRDLFSSVSTLIKPKLEEKKVDLEIEFSEEDLMIEADFGLMQQVLINLINNSLYALNSQTDPKIKLTIKIFPKKLSVEVFDNGPGIPADLLEDIFVPFFSTRKDGSGLGLSLVKLIIISHGGSISVDSVVNEYTRFQIELPVN